MIHDQVLLLLVDGHDRALKVITFFRRLRLAASGSVRLPPPPHAAAQRLRATLRQRQACACMPSPPLAFRCAPCLYRCTPISVIAGLIRSCKRVASSECDLRALRIPPPERQALRSAASDRITARHRRPGNNRIMRRRPDFASATVILKTSSVRPRAR